MPCTTVNAVHVCYDGEFSRIKSVQRAPFDRIPPDPVRIAGDGKHDRKRNGPGPRNDKIGRIKSRSINKYRVGESHYGLERPDEIVGRSQNFFSWQKVLAESDKHREHLKTMGYGEILINSNDI